MHFAFLLLSYLIVHVSCNLEEHCKTLTLPWGNYSATYDSTSKVSCTHTNPFS